MPDDPLIPQPPAAGGNPAAQPEAAPGIDAETLQNLVSQALEPHVAQHRAELETMREQNESLQREITQMRSQPATPPLYAEPETPTTSDESLSQFMADPNGFIAQAVSKAMDPKFQEFAGQMAPIVGKFNELGQQTLTQYHRNDIDHEFGAGTFDETFQPLLTRRLKQESEMGQPLRASDKDWMDSEMKAIKGHLFNDLSERRTAHQKSVADGAEQQTADLVSRVTTNLGPGGFGNNFFANEGDEPTSDQQAFLDSRSRAMGKREKGLPTFDEMNEVGKFQNLDDYKEAMAAKANGSTGSAN